MPTSIEPRIECISRELVIFILIIKSRSVGVMKTVKTPDPQVIRSAVLDWYDAHRRDLPWRTKPGEHADPYHVWLSEIMLQQTTVATVGPYFGDFVATWPTVGALAGASLDDVLVKWQGLGYYARARNLHKCALVVTDDLNGQFPTTVNELEKLPGIGPYTAAAIAAIAFDQPAVPVDGNIERVCARLHEIREQLPKGKVAIKAAAETYTGSERPGDFAQALMDLGATVCTPSSPKCPKCPLKQHCGAHASGRQETIPVRAPKKKRPERCCVMFWLQNEDGELLLRKRDERGLLGGMSELPSTPWLEGAWPDDREIIAHQPVGIEWDDVPGEAHHIFTHFRLSIRVQRGVVDQRINTDGFWVKLEDLPKHALPTAIKKAIALVRAWVSVGFD